MSGGMLKDVEGALDRAITRERIQWSRLPDWDEPYPAKVLNLRWPWLARLAARFLNWWVRP